MPRGYEIPIAINSKEAEPEKGKFRRLGLDVAANATWVAMKWALDEENKEAESGLENLILDRPFDFHIFEATDEEVEEKIAKHIIMNSDHLGSYDKIKDEITSIYRTKKYLVTGPAPTDVGAVDPRPRCDICGRPGHTRRECWYQGRPGERGRGGKDGGKGGKGKGKDGGKGKCKDGKALSLIHI